MSLWSDQRGLGIGFVLFFFALVIAALLFVLMNPVIEQVKTMMLGTTSNQDATGLINERVKIWDQILIFVLFMSSIGLIARAVFESGVR